MKVTIELPITEQGLLDVITNAIEGNGIQYWATEQGPINIWRDKELNIVKATFKLDDETKKITPAVIERGIKNIFDAKGYNKLKGELTNEDPDLDAWDDDVIIQFGLFGEERYS